MKCVSLFSGAGGLDLGFEAAGFEIVASIEQDRDCCATLSANASRRVIKDDVANVDFSQFGEPHTVDLLIGGPPCQPFSKSALWTHKGARGLSDPRTKTIDSFVQAIKQLRPRAFVIENVEGFAKLGGLRSIVEALSGLGEDEQYTIASSVPSASDFGVPQRRRRFFAVGIRGTEKFEFPRPTHGPSLKPYVSAWDACASVARSNDLAEALAVKGRWAALLPTIPPGNNYLWHTGRGGGEAIFGWRTRYWSFLYKLDPNAPSPTIVANPSQNSGPFHWENRLLSTREMAAIQTFPTHYQFIGNRASRQRQIGNAVPPLLAEHIGRALISKLGGTVPGNIKFALDPCTEQPLVPGPTALPATFRSLIGRHPDHPGTGLGPKPRRNTTQQGVSAL